MLVHEVGIDFTSTAHHDRIARQLGKHQTATYRNALIVAHRAPDLLGRYEHHCLGGIKNREAACALGFLGFCAIC